MNVNIACMKIGLTQRAPNPRKSTETMVVGLLLRSVRVFRQFVWLEADSIKVASPRPTHQYPGRLRRGITQTVGPTNRKHFVCVDRA